MRHQLIELFQVCTRQNRANVSLKRCSWKEAGTNEHGERHLRELEQQIVYLSTVSSVTSRTLKIKSNIMSNSVKKVT